MNFWLRIAAHVDVDEKDTTWALKSWIAVLLAIMFEPLSGTHFLLGIQNHLHTTDKDVTASAAGTPCCPLCWQLPTAWIQTRLCSSPARP